MWKHEGAYASTSVCFKNAFAQEGAFSVFLYRECFGPIIVTYQKKDGLVPKLDCLILLFVCLFQNLLQAVTRIGL